MRNKGITLIALIITIIVLLILSAVTISMLLGDSGIIFKAQIAKERNDLAQKNEDKDLQELNNKLNEYFTGSRNFGTQRDLLYSNEDGWNSGDLSLSNPWNQYSTLMFIGCFMSVRSFAQVEYVPLELLNYNKKNDKWFYFSQDDIHYFSFKIKDESSFSYINSRGSAQCIYYVYGIK